VALCEFFDPENLGSHLIWLPIHQLYEPDMPLAPRSSGSSKKSVCADYLQAVDNINYMFARKTLIQFFISANQGIKPLALMNSPSKTHEEQDISKII
jgi:hypothetical protein